MQMDDDILQDFLIEAQEILDNLDSQLITLESAPDDQALLNTVFRGFHTIKGGAGFLSLEPLVQVAHKAEDVFDLLRNGQCRLTPAIMDLFLRVLDTLRGMFDALREGATPEFADPGLIAGLVAVAQGDTAAPAAAPVAVAVAEPEFDAVVAAMLADAPTAEAAPAAASDLITDDEFELLLDRLQGAGAPAAARPVAAAAAGASAASDLMSDDEFESLLDNMHGKGRFVAPAATPGAADPTASVMAMVVAVPEAATARVPAPKKPEAGEADNTIRVSTDVLDRIMNMVGELVLIRNRLENLQESIGNPEMTQAVANLDVVTSDLQMTAMKTRMQPIKKVFGRFPRVVRDLARSLNKEIELVMAGEDTDLDKNLVDALADPLVHLVRNSCDHGIELPEVRESAGKPRSGTLKLAAEQVGDQIVLTIADDGKGMNADLLRAKSVEKGLLDEDAAARLSERECFELIFLPGFSTKEQISDVSGRGVGMDVVKTRITQLNGSIEIDSRVGIGTTIQISVPLTLAIMPTLMVMLGRQVFALPLVNVKEIIDFKREDARDVNGRKTLVVRDKALPLFYMSRWLVRGVHELLVDQGHVVVVSVGNQQIGLLVDELIGQEEVVIKPLGIMLQGTKGLSGATITGNGRIALILDLPDLIDAYGRR
ncbi:MAG: chemotaxis protein CheA [Gammaproteobacteria bacterium]